MSASRSDSPDTALQPNPDVERALEAQIEPWLAHMRWRADFDDWRYKRLWQENFQRATVDEVRHVSRAPCLASQSSARANGSAREKYCVLDLGAGMGGFAVALRRAGIPVIAFDYNFAYCEIARTRAERYALPLSALVGAGEALPFADASFQVVTCWDVLEHVQAPERLLAEISRVLGADGVAFMTVINRFALVDPHYHLRFVNYLPRPLGEQYIAWRQRTKASPLRDRQRLGDMHYFTYGAFAQTAARHGFAVQDLNASRSRFQNYPRRVGDALYTSWRTFGMGTYRLALHKQAQRAESES